MDRIMKSLMKSSLLSSIALLVLGVLLVFQSEITIVSISYIIGALLVAFGVIPLINYKKDNNPNNDLNIIYGIVSVILGIIIISNPEGIASIIPFIVGVIIILNSGAKIQYSIELKKDNNELWKSTLVLSLITFLCGILLIFNPFQGAVLITKIVGLLIIFYSLLDIISTLLIRNTFKEIHDAIEESVSEVKLIEDKKKKKTPKKKKKEEEIKDADIEESEEEDNND